MEPKIKTIGTNYIIKVNGEFAETKPTLGEARRHVRAMPIHDSILKVEILKQTLTEQVLDVYETKTKKVLEATDLGLDDEI